MLVTQFFSGRLIGLSVGLLAVARTLGTTVCVTAHSGLKLVALRLSF